MTINKITILKGNPYIGAISVIDSSGNPYDLTGKTVMFTVKNLYDNTDTDSLALIQKDVTVHDNPEQGKTSINLTSEETDVHIGFYKWDIRVYEASKGIQMNTTTGACEIKDVVTKRKT